MTCSTYSWWLTVSTDSWWLIVSAPSGRSEVVEVGAHRRHKKQQTNIQCEFVEDSVQKNKVDDYQIAFYKTLSVSMNAQVSQNMWNFINQITISTNNMPMQRTLDKGCLHVIGHLCSHRLQVLAASRRCSIRRNSPSGKVVFLLTIVITP